MLDEASGWYGNIRKKKGSKYWLSNLETMAVHYGVDLDLPWQDLPQKFREVVLYGSGDEKIHFPEKGDHSKFGQKSPDSVLK